MADATNDVVINYKSVNFDGVDKEIKKLSVDMDGMVVEFNSAEKASTALENRFKSLERQTGTAAGNAEQYAKKMATVNNAVAQNPELQGRGAEVQARLAERYGQVSNAVKTVGTAMEQTGQKAGISQNQMLIAGAQIKDAFEGLVSGQGPIRVLAQQLPALAQVAAYSGVSMGTMFKQMAAGALEFVTPTRVAIGGIAALGAGIAYMAQSSRNEFDEIQKSLLGFGQRLGVTVGDVKKFSVENSSYMGLSITEARKAADEFIRFGTISINSLHGAGDAIKGYGVLTQDAEGASSKFAALLSGPLGKAVDELKKSYGTLTNADKEYVESLDATGKHAQGAQYIIDRLAETNQKAEQTAGSFGERVSRVFSGVKDVFYRATTDVRTFGEQLADEQNRLATMKLGGFSEADIAKQQAVIARLVEQINKIDTQRAQGQLLALKDSVENLTKSIIPQIGQIELLDQALAKLREGQEKGVGGPNAEKAIIIAQELRTQARETLDIQVRQAKAADDLRKNWGGVSLETAKTLQSLEDSTRLIKAQAKGTGDAAERAIAYDTAIRNGATATEAAAIEAAVLSNQIAKSAESAGQFQARMQAATQAMMGAAGRGWVPDQTYVATSFASRAAGEPGSFVGGSAGGGGVSLMPGLNFGGLYGSPSVAELEKQYAGGVSIKNTGSVQGAADDIIKASGSIDQAIGTLSAMGSDYVSSVTTLYGIKLQQATENAAKAAITQQEIGYLQRQQQTTDVRSQIASLTSSLQQLSTSTDQLNATNQELLSPYYTQDPRTSHIGFRSQGMASGGYVDVPGGVSANDNIIASIPVASGERIYVDPMGSKRGMANGGNLTINISSPVLIQGNADRDQIGRSLYQNNQALAKQMRAAAQ